MPTDKERMDWLERNCDVIETKNFGPFRMPEETIREFVDRYLSKGTEIG